MNYLKQYWREILIVFLIIFGMNKCANSCTNSNKYNASEKVKTELVHEKDSIIKIYDDSVKNLTMKIQVLEATINGNQEMINRLAKANEQISEAKKNINVSVKSNR